MKTSIGLLILALFLTGFSTLDGGGKVVTRDAFAALIKPMGLRFTMPDGYKEAKVMENRDLYYAFAMKDKKADFEVRYSIWSLQPAIAEYEACQRDTHCLMVPPNNLYKGRIQANVLNMTRGQGADIGAFRPEAVQKEFHADAGGASFFELNCEFGKGYRYGQMVFLHKDDVADVIITFLSNDKSTHTDLMMKPFYALTFQPS